MRKTFIQAVNGIFSLILVLSLLTACGKEMPSDNSNVFESPEQTQSPDATGEGIDAVADVTSYEAVDEPAEQIEEIILGDQRFDEYLPMLAGKSVAVFSNQTGIVGGDTSKNKHIVDVLIENGIDVTCLFCPEHGFRGEAGAGELIDDSVDPATGLPIISLYKADGRQAVTEATGDIDVLVIDIQDVGLRFYTYYITMMELMEQCAESETKVIVLDRPNPNGFYVDGPILKEEFKSDVGKLPIPAVYGMTIGELALMINGEGWLSAGEGACDLTVVSCEGYDHQSRFRLEVNPSPNLRSMQAVYLYPSICLFENTVISVGRGTEHPFEIFGSPYLEQNQDYDYTFTPVSVGGATDPPFEGEVCYGKDLTGLPEEEIFEKGINLDFLIEAKEAVADSGFEVSFWGKSDKYGHYWIDYLMGTDEVRFMIDEGKSAEEIKASWTEELENFRLLRSRYLLYDD